MFSCEDAGYSKPAETQVGCVCCSPALQRVARRIDRDISRRGFIAGIGASLSSLGFAPRAAAQAADAARPVVFSNFLLFDGKSASLRGGLRLLVGDGRVKTLGTNDLPPPDGATIID